MNLYFYNPLITWWITEENDMINGFDYADNIDEFPKQFIDTIFQNVEIHEKTLEDNPDKTNTVLDK